MKKLLLITAALGLATASFAAKVKITVNNIQQSKGWISIAVIEQGYEANFPNEGRMLFEQADGSMQPGINVPAQIPSVSTEVDLRQGVYAVAVFQDMNKDGRMRTVPFIGLPLEPYGFSNDARSTFGPPSFAQASFEVNGDMAIEFDVAQ